ncbi:MAG: pseudouridine synthase [Candidatus Syntrophopropionicum ammoniitolerans]
MDYDSEGLLLLTNDGDLTHALTHPRTHKIPKTYQVRVAGVPDKIGLKQMEKGLLLADGLLLPPKSGSRAKKTAMPFWRSLFTKAVNTRLNGCAHILGIL